MLAILLEIILVSENGINSLTSRIYDFLSHKLVAKLTVPGMSSPLVSLTYKLLVIIKIQVALWKHLYQRRRICKLFLHFLVKL